MKQLKIKENEFKRETERIELNKCRKTFSGSAGPSNRFKNNKRTEIDTSRIKCLNLVDFTSLA